MTAAAVFAAYRSAQRSTAMRRSSLAHYYGDGYIGTRVPRKQVAEWEMELFPEEKKEETRPEERGEGGLRFLVWVAFLLPFVLLLACIIRWW